MRFICQQKQSKSKKIIRSTCETDNVKYPNVNPQEYVTLWRRRQGLRFKVDVPSVKILEVL